ncbi:MAG: hypothetical protein AB2693_06000 [Candidatus Thiodiazotropha sp.]
MPRGRRPPIFSEREFSRSPPGYCVNTLPCGNIPSTGKLGCNVSARHRAQSAAQAEFAALCGIGVRFISALENVNPPWS